MKNAIRIKIDDLTNQAVIDLIVEHRRSMLELTPEESVHALDLKALRESRITFWTAWNSQNLMGCGALKELNEHEAEIKSMRTHAAYLKQGVAEKILMHIIEEAQRRRYSKVYLETGVHQAFFPAHKLYKKFGFTECPPFADYTKDSNSCFMVKNLERL